MKSFAAVLLAAGLFDATSAWWGVGHLLVARGAYDILQEEAPEALAAANAELVALKQDQPDITGYEDNYPFVECATFADNVKKDMWWQGAWHYIDQPYLDQGGSLDDYSFTMPTHVVTDAIDCYTTFLSTGDDNCYYVESLQRDYDNNDDVRSFALRLVIHFIGDVHQPLHATTLVDNTYPSGDNGGNNEKLPSIEGASNLHSVWDSVIYQYTGYPDLPLNNADWNTLGDNISNMSDDIYVPTSDWHTNDTMQWAAESLQASKDTVYPDVVVGEALSDEYIARATPVANERIVYGARRLAEQIKLIYGTNSA